MTGKELFNKAIRSVHTMKIGQEATIKGLGHRRTVKLIKLDDDNKVTFRTSEDTLWSIGTVEEAVQCAISYKRRIEEGVK